MSKLGRQIAATYGTEVVGILCGITFGIIAARALEADGRGQVAAVWTAYTIAAMVAGMGLSKALVSRLNIGKSGLEPHDFLTSLVVLIPAQLLLYAAVLLPILPSSEPRLAVIAFWIAIIAGPTHLIGDMSRAIHRSRRRISVVNIGYIAAAVFRVTAILFCWRINSVSVEVVLQIELAAISLTMLIAVGTLLPRIHLSAMRYSRLPKAVLELSIVGLTYQGYALAFGLINKTNVMILNATVSDTATGHYAVAARLAEYLGSFTNALNLALIPFLAQVSASAARYEYAAGACRTVIIALVPLTAILALSAPVYVPFLYGASFSGSVIPLQIMLVAVSLQIVFQLVAAPELADGRLAGIVIIAISALALNVALAAWLIPRLGAVGASIASLSGFAYAVVAIVVRGHFRGRAILTDFLIPKPFDLQLIVRQAKAASVSWRNP